MIQKVAQELQDSGEKDCNWIHPSGCHLHQMCQWLPLEFWSSQPARAIQQPCPLLALLVWEHGSPCLLQTKPDLQDVLGIEFIAQRWAQTQPDTKCAHPKHRNNSSANVRGCFEHESKLLSDDRLLSLEAYNQMKQCATGMCKYERKKRKYSLGFS